MSAHLRIWLAIALFTAFSAATNNASTQKISEQYNRGNIAQALSMARIDAAAHPTDATAQKWLGFLLMQNKNYSQAMDTLNLAASLDAKSPEIALYQGICSYDLKDFPSAIEHLTRALQLKKNYPLAVLNLANAYLSAQNSAKAVQYYALAAKHFAKDPVLLNNYSTALRQEKRQSEAIAILNRAIALAPKRGDLYSNRAWAYLEMGKTAAAEQSFREALANGGNSYLTRMGLGEIFAKSNKIEPAISQFAIAAKLKPRDLAANFNLGLLCDQKGRFKEAVSAFRAALAASPESAQIMNHLGWAYFKTNKSADGISMLKTAVERDPSLASAWQNLGSVYLSDKQYKEAAEAMTKYCELTPSDSTALLELAGIYLNSLDYTNALTTYQKAAQVTPSSAKAYYGIGACQSGLNAGADAIASYRKAITLDPMMSDAYNNLGVELEKTGALAQAKVEYKQALKANPRNAQAKANLRRFESSGSEKAY